MTCPACQCIAARLGVGYLPQEASVFRTLSVSENIMAILEAVEPSPDIRAQRVEELMDDFAIGPMPTRPTSPVGRGTPTGRDWRAGE